MYKGQYMIPRRFFWLVDIVCLGLSFSAAYYLLPYFHARLSPGGILDYSWFEKLSPHATGPLEIPPFQDFLWILLVAIPPTILFLEMFGNYRALMQLSFRRIAIGSLASPWFSLSLVVLGLFATKRTDWSRLFIFSFATLSGVGLCSLRLLLRTYFLSRRAAGCYTENVVLIGSTPVLEAVGHYLVRNFPKSEYQLLGYLPLSSAQPALIVEGETVAMLGEISQLGDLLIHMPIHEVIVAYPSCGGDWLGQVVKDCDYFRVSLRIIPDALLEEKPKDLQILGHLDGFQLPAIVYKPLNVNSDALFLKRVFDIAISAAFLAILLPVFVLIGITIKLTTPTLPIFYRWRVVGKNGTEFVGFKFTSMLSDADLRRSELLEKNEMSGPVFKIKDDPRTTPFGRFLRKYSLNELPQLWSVLKGDMSLVGPRPAFRHELDGYLAWHKRKLSIKPGITCLWQVRGRNRIKNFDDWVKMDLEYIDNWSLWLDFKILLRTAWVVIRGTGS